MKKALVITILFFGGIVKGMAQVPVWPIVVDVPRLAAAGAETLAAQALGKVKNNTAKGFATTAATSTIEILGQARLGLPTSWVNFLEYEGLCDVYRSPGKKKLCNARYTYLQQAFVNTFTLIATPPAHAMTEGRKDLIKEKYASICNLITKDLDRMRTTAEEDTKYSSLKYFK